MNILEGLKCPEGDAQAKTKIDILERVSFGHLGKFRRIHRVAPTKGKNNRNQMTSREARAGPLEWRIPPLAPPASRARERKICI